MNKMITVTTVFDGAFIPMFIISMLRSQRQELCPRSDHYQWYECPRQDSMLVARPAHVGLGEALPC